MDPVIMPSSEYSSPAEGDSTVFGSPSYDGVSNSNEEVFTPNIRYHPPTDPPPMESPPANPRRSLSVPGKEGSSKTKASRLSFKKSVRSLRPQASRKSLAPTANSVDKGPSASPPGRTLHIHRIGLTERHLVIKDNDDTTPLYIVDNHNGYSKRPHVEIFSATTSGKCSPVYQSESIATAVMSGRVRATYISIYGQPCSMTDTGYRTIIYTFQGANLGQVRWISEGFWRTSWKCVDSDEQTIARYRYRGFGRGKLVLLQNATGGGWAMAKKVVDEIVVSILAIRKTQRIRSGQYAYGGGTGGAAGGAVCSTGGGGC